MFSLSKVITISTNFGFASSFFTEAQVGSLPKTIMTADMTVATSCGGFVKDLISAMYFLSRLSRASYAASNAGSAFLSSASASAANFSVSSLSFSTLTLSTSINFYFSSAFFYSFYMLILSSSHIFYCFDTSILLISLSAVITSTIFLASSNFCNPFLSLLIWFPTSFLFAPMI